MDGRPASAAASENATDISSANASPRNSRSRRRSAQNPSRIRQNDSVSLRRPAAMHGQEQNQQSRTISTKKYALAENQVAERIRQVQLLFDGLKQQRMQQPNQIEFLRQQHLHNAESSCLRLVALSAAESVLLRHTNEALSSGLFETVWTVGFHSYTETLRSLIHALHSKNSEENCDKKQIDSLLSELSAFLNSAASFYQTLILQIECRNKNVWAAYSIEELLSASASTDGTNPLRTDYNIVWRSLVCLGDIERYKSAFRPASASVARKYYQKAFRLWPAQARPHSQIALLPKTNLLDSSYYAVLSVGNVVSGSVPQENLARMYKKAEVAARSSDKSLSCIANIVSAQGDLFSAKNASIDVFRRANDAVHRIAQESNLLAQTDASTLFKLSVMYIVIMHSLDQRFLLAEHASLKQSIRYAQTAAVAGLLHLTSVSMAALLKNFENTTGQNKDSTINNAVDAVDQHERTSSIDGALMHGAIVCIFLAHNPHQLGILQTYAKTINIPSQAESLEVFLHQLAQLSNQISSFADMDGSTDAVPEDAELVGLLCMQSIYRSLSTNSLQRCVFRRSSSGREDPASARYSRIAGFAYRLAGSNTIDAFTRSENGLEFIYRSSKSRRQDQLKFMKLFAAERLKSQMDDQQTQNTSAQPRNVFLAIPDPDAVMNGLSVIKSCLMRKACVVGIALEVIHILDTCKEDSYEARECIRYLEQRFKYGSPFLIGQKPTDFTKLPVRETSFNSWLVTNESDWSVRFESSTSLPKPISSLRLSQSQNLFLSYCLHMKLHPPTLSFLGPISRVVIISDDAEYTDLTTSLGIECMSLDEWSKTIQASI